MVLPALGELGVGGGCALLDEPGQPPLDGNEALSSALHLRGDGDDLDPRECAGSLLLSAAGGAACDARAEPTQAELYGALAVAAALARSNGTSNATNWTNFSADGAPNVSATWLSALPLDADALALRLHRVCSCAWTGVPCPPSAPPPSPPPPPAAPPPPPPDPPPRRRRRRLRPRLRRHCRRRRRRRRNRRRRRRRRRSAAPAAAVAASAGAAAAIATAAATASAVSAATVASAVAAAALTAATLAAAAVTAATLATATDTAVSALFAAVTAVAAVRRRRPRTASRKSKACG